MYLLAPAAHVAPTHPGPWSLSRPGMRPRPAQFGLRPRSAHAREGPPGSNFPDVCRLARQLLRHPRPKEDTGPELKMEFCRRKPLDSRQCWRWFLCYFLLLLPYRRGISNYRETRIVGVVQNEPQYRNIRFLIRSKYDGHILVPCIASHAIMPWLLGFLTNLTFL